MGQLARTPTRAYPMQDVCWRPVRAMADDPRCQSKGSLGTKGLWPLIQPGNSSLKITTDEGIVGWSELSRASRSCHARANAVTAMIGGDGRGLGTGEARAFALYLGFAITGAVIAGYGYAAVLAIQP